MNRRDLFAALTTVLLLLPAVPVRAGEVRVAVAANFTSALKAIAGDFERDTGHRVLLSSGSTGQLYAQIRNGAPFDLFLAADSRRPRLLEEEGAAVPGSRFTYAVGRLVLWSPEAGRVDEEGAVLKGDGFRRLAIASPKTAPYGEAAREVLEHMGLWETVQPRLVRGQSITQTHQFVASGNAGLGFVALSQVIDTPGGSRWDVPSGLYSPLLQDAVLLTGRGDAEVARRFHAYLRGDAARAIIQRFGYGTE